MPPLIFKNSSLHLVLSIRRVVPTRRSKTILRNANIDTWLKLCVCYYLMPLYHPLSSLKLSLLLHFLSISYPPILFNFSHHINFFITVHPIIPLSVFLGAPAILFLPLTLATSYNLTPLPPYSLAMLIFSRVINVSILKQVVLSSLATLSSMKQPFLIITCTFPPLPGSIPPQIPHSLLFCYLLLHLHLLHIHLLQLPPLNPAQLSPSLLLQLAVLNTNPSTILLHCPATLNTRAPLIIPLHSHPRIHSVFHTIQ